jgi:predicted CoA-binding protein
VPNFSKDEQLIKQILTSAKTIAMVGVSSIKKEESPNKIRRRPSIIVMKYLKEFGYKVIPINPSSIGEKIHEETVVANLEDVTIPIDIVNVFRPSIEVSIFAKQAVKIGAKVLWLQYGVQNREAQKIANSANVIYIANRCIKQEYQRLFLKVSPVFPALQSN